ncbi:D-alanyl-D-alanine carboxypeptidase family protein [Ammoniphilus sp. YIM 78166]|uniref:D-alanyl-D-alanine carboxypeptidase family protein n=1 Tax=Ammoniphilus sp. YIM 78166 TaxID=1644106 RepID=UPI001F113CFE|nr:D-alanyl-D-alanine carboxypeptidase family protein [Ammoniphilus sp. YIM 78166]
MKYNNKKPLAALLTLALMFLFVFPMGNPAQAAPADINLEVKSAIMVEAKTGRVLYKMNEDEALPPASMTKMMTELLVLEAVKSGKITWEDPVKTSEYGHWMGRYGGSRVYLGLGEVRTVKELYEAMAIYSANDATVMLAEHISGTEENFAKLMNQKAADLGMVNSYYVTSTGYPASGLKQFLPNAEGDNLMTAKDSAILAREIITKYPEALEISSIPRKFFRGEDSPQKVRMDNWNFMLPSLVYGFEGVDGLKTGHTDAAKYCFTGTAERNGMRIITVVMGAQTEAKRFAETRKLMTHGFNNFKMQTVATKGQAIEGFETVDVKKGKELLASAVSEVDMAVPVRIGEEDKYKPVVVTEEVIAPIEKGQSIGKITVEYTGEDPYEFLRPVDQEQATVNLVAQEEIEEAGWIRLFFRAIKNFIGGIFDSITGMF